MESCGHVVNSKCRMTCCDTWLLNILNMAEGPATNDIHNFFEHVLLDSMKDPKQIVDDIYEAHQYFKCKAVLCDNHAKRLMNVTTSTVQFLPHGTR